MIVRPLPKMIEDVSELTPDEIAHMGGVSCSTELGRVWMKSIVESWVDVQEQYEDRSRLVIELGKDAVPIPTWDLFHLWADLALWQIDLAAEMYGSRTDVPVETQAADAIELVANRILCQIEDLYKQALWDDSAAGPEDEQAAEMWDQGPVSDD